MSEITRMYRCIHCDKTFTRESWFKRHMCDKKKQFHTVNNLDQIKALKLFNHWLRRNGFIKKKSKERTMMEFQKSEYAKTFLGLVKFTNDTYVITPFKYLNWLSDKQVKAHDWCKESTVELYRAEIARSDDPLVQARATYHWIRDYCMEKNIPLPRFFSEIGVGDAVFMVTSQRISPWVLLGYDASMEQLVERIDHERFLILDEHIGLQYWLDKMEHNPDKRAEVNAYCAEHFRAE